MFKDILVPLTGTPGDADAIRHALMLASGTGGHVSLLEMVNLPMMASGPWGLGPDMALADLYRELRAKGARNVSELKARLAREPVSTEVRLVESLYQEPPRMAAHCAHYADLVVLGSSPTTEPGLTLAYAGALLIESGRPLLVVPPGCQAPMPPRRIVAAWKPTREAARAFHDALPLFEQAEAIDILIVNPRGGERGHGEQPGADVAMHLLRHGLHVDVVVLPAGEDSIARAILRHAHQTGAELLVAGGYGHSRFREWVLGGATRDLFEAAQLPILFSH